jgi:hypothetical protein
MMTDTETKAMTLSHPTFSPEFVEFLTNSSLDDIHQAYSDSYKEWFGIRPRWVMCTTREGWAEEFVLLGAMIRAEEDRAREEDEYIEWMSRPENQPLVVAEPEPLAYEHLMTAAQLEF